MMIPTMTITATIAATIGVMLLEVDRVGGSEVVVIVVVVVVVVGLLSIGAVEMIESTMNVLFLSSVEVYTAGNKHFI